MKTFLLTTASILLLTSAGVGYAVHANPETTPVSENSTAKNHLKVQIDAEDIYDLAEYEILDDVADADDFNAQVVENSNHKRVILLKDDNGQPQFKSIYVKDTNRLKVIDFKDGLVFNQILDDIEEDIDTDDYEGSDNEAVEEDNQDNDATEQETGLEGLAEYSTLANYVDVNDFNAQVVENNPHKRVIILKDDHGQLQFKSIYVKDTSRLKIINLQGGLVYNGIVR